MPDGEVKIVVDAEDSGVEKQLEEIEKAADGAADGLEELGKSVANAGKGLKDAEEKAEKAGKKFKLLGKETDLSSLAMGVLEHATGNLLSGGIEGLITGLGDAVTSLISLADETREFREDMAKLETAFKDAGHAPEVAQKSYEDFYAILGESDRSVEAVNHLAELTDNTEELSKWSTIAAGVTAKFGDSLPIEGLTEAANETAKVGAVTGPLADALNWAGISEDKFNEALKKCNSEQERATLITNTLNTEYAEAAAEYNTLTASTQAARRATAEMEAAQARLGAAVEPLSTMITTAKTAFFDFAANLAENVATNIEKTREATTGLNAEQRLLVENSLAAAEQINALKLAADEAAIGISSQFNYTQSLADELLRLADANGVVADADKARAEFILGELNSALGTEYSMTGNIISNYNNIKDSIYGVIEAKRAQILLQQYEEEYAEAVKNIAEQEKARAEQAIALTEAVSAVEEAELEAKRIRAEMEKSLLEDSSTANVRAWGEKVKAAEDAVLKQKNHLDEMQSKYDETDAAVETSLSAINAYEKASTAILNGETDKAIDILNNYGNGFDNTATTVSEAHEKELASLKNKVIATSIQLGKLEEEYKAKQDSMTAEQIKEMEARIEAAKKEAQDARTEYKKVGGDMVEGLVEGVDEKNGNPIWNLAGKMKQIVARAIQGAKDAAEIKSPSRKMRREVGHELIDGAILGLDDREAELYSTMSQIGSGVVEEAAKSAEEAVKALEKKQKQEVKALEDHIEELSEKRTKANAKQIDAQIKANRKELEALKEKNREELEIAKEREKAYSDALKRYEKYLSDLNKLNEDYANNYKKIQTQLDADIAKEVENFKNLVDSRYQSIKNSLNLFDAVEKREKVSGKELTKNLITQVSELKKYDAVLTELSSRDVDKSFIEEMLGLGVDYLPELEAINKMTDKELNKYVELWKEKSELAMHSATTASASDAQEMLGNIEKLKTQAKEDAEILTLTYHQNLTELAKTVGEDMALVGEAGVAELGKQLGDYADTGAELMNSIAEGILSRESAVVNAAASVVAAAIAEAQRMAGIQARLQSTVSSENAKFGATSQSAGTSMASEIVNAVGAQSAGINSLAGVLTANTNAPRNVVIELDRRELGRAVVDVGNAETSRVGSTLSVR